MASHTRERYNLVNNVAKVNFHIVTDLNISVNLKIIKNMVRASGKVTLQTFILTVMKEAIKTI